MKNKAITRNDHETALYSLPNVWFPFRCAPLESSLCQADKQPPKIMDFRVYLALCLCLVVKKQQQQQQLKDCDGVYLK